MAESVRDYINNAARHNAMILAKIRQLSADLAVVAADVEANAEGIAELAEIISEEEE